MENREIEGMEKQWRRGATGRGVITENMDKAKTNEKEGKPRAREGENERQGRGKHGKEVTSN